ncbi:hypothetical protein [Caulobacter sp. 17J65-9]|uniref:hypothetical protein n=1 Tax=Caulobacter sp. 17J65-9 TaxID=2709382 RepID=UPI0013C88D2B|nr:hypothetical protein [Caulobacter sp. 17J65-9]NEX95348.1 hypothetical protein [Caulobacter sp. 17J65-9]
MSDQVPAATSDAGKSSAIAVYVLYLLSIPSVGVLVLVGLVWAYVARAEAAGWVRTHFDQQIRVFWVAFWWAVGLGVLGVIGVLLLAVLIGLPILAIAGLLGLVVTVWFCLKSALGLVALLQDRPA